jgi:hypothetical protein
MFSSFGKWGVRVVALAGASIFLATPAQAGAPVCNTLTIGPIPNYATTQITITEQTILYHCTDPDGDTLHATSPYGLPFTIYVWPNGQTYPASSFTNTVTDGNGGTTSQTITVLRGGY